MGSLLVVGGSGGPGEGGGELLDLVGLCGAIGGFDDVDDVTGVLWCSHWGNLSRDYINEVHDVCIDVVLRNLCVDV